jgi:hypothetical protein
MRAEVGRRNLWEDTIFPGLYISPILGDLLASRAEVDEADIDTVTLEAFRLAAVLYVSNLRAKFGIDTLSGGPLYITKLRALLSSPPIVREIQPMLLIWILSVAFTSQCLPAQSTWLSEIFTDILATKNITSFADLKATITQVVWDEDLLISQTQSLRTFCEA